MNIEAVNRAKQGDVDEIGNIIKENMTSLYRIAYSILKNEDEIYDAISSTTIIVFEKISTLKQAEFFKTWITRILINECYKIYNQNKKIVYLENNQNIEQLKHVDTYSEINIKELLKKINKDLRQIVVLYYIEDLSIKDIAKILEIPEGTVKSRLSRARKELEQILIKNESEERRNSNG